MPDVVSVGLRFCSSSSSWTANPSDGDGNEFDPTSARLATNEDDATVLPSPNVESNVWILSSPSFGVYMLYTLDVARSVEIWSLKADIRCWRSSEESVDVLVDDGTTTMMLVCM